MSTWSGGARGEEAAAWLAERLAAMEEALAPLVETNSFTENVEGSRAVAARLVELLAIEGLAPRVVPSVRFGDHVVATSRPGAPGAIALLGHLDTVFPPSTFEGYRRDGALRRGPGVLDMKGGLVVVVFAIRALAETIGLASIPPLRIAIVSDEEVGSPEGQGVIRDAIAGSASALVFESGRAGDAIITRRKGTGFVRVIARGVAAHAGNAHAEGRNAIWALARFVDRVQSLTDYARGVTVNVGIVRGGQSKNTVPEHAEADVDLRFTTVGDADALIASLRAIAEEVSRSLPGTSIALEGGVARLPMEATDASRGLMDRYAACARAVGLSASESPLLGGGSDASTSSAMGIASIDGLGPRGKGFHTRDEQIEVATLVPKAQALARFLATEPA